MNQNKYMMGVDIGTTSTKAVLYRETGEILASANHGYDLHTPDNFTAEQDPFEIFMAVKLSIKQAMRDSAVEPEDVSFISFSSAMHSVIAVDSDGFPVTPCITWADNRSAEWSRRIEEELSGHEIYLRTGTPLHPMSPITKIAWLQHDRLDIADRVHKYIGIKEYVFYRLFGTYQVDHSIASATGLFNLESLDWDVEAMAAAGITREMLSDLKPTTEIITGCDSQIAREIGIHPDTKFVIGASDGVLSNIGVNAFKEGEVAVTIGTSGAIRTVINEPRTDEKGRIFCYALTEDKWVIGGPVNNGGMVLRWIRDEFAASEVETAKRLNIDAYQVLTQIASQVPPGADGLLFHPFLAGERAPLWNADVRGSFFGLTLNHKKEHMVRAALEGVIYNLYSVYLALVEVMDSPVKSIKATGGFSKSELWRQMMADIFDESVMVPKSHESSCLGACMLGLYAEGKIESFDVVESLVGHTHTHEPNPEHTKYYQELIPIFIRVSRGLENEYKEIAKYQTRHTGE